MMLFFYNLGLNPELKPVYACGSPLHGSYKLQTIGAAVLVVLVPLISYLSRQTSGNQLPLLHSSPLLTWWDLPSSSISLLCCHVSESNSVSQWACLQSVCSLCFFPLNLYASPSSAYSTSLPVVAVDKKHWIFHQLLWIPPFCPSNSFQGTPLLAFSNATGLFKVLFAQRADIQHFVLDKQKRGFPCKDLM